MSQSLEHVWKKYDVAYSSALDFFPPDLLPLCKQVKFVPGDIVVNEGDLLTDVIFIQSGIVNGMKCFENGKDYQYFKLDHCNGALGLLELFSQQRAMLATIIARTNLSVLCVPAVELYTFAMNDLPLFRKINFIISSDLYINSNLSGKLIYLNGFERLCSYLTDYFQKHDEGRHFVVVKQSYQEIANYIGMSQRTVVRAVRELRELELCTMSAKQIRITKDQLNTIRTIFSQRQ